MKNNFFQRVIVRIEEFVNPNPRKVLMAKVQDIIKYIDISEGGKCPGFILNVDITEKGVVMYSLNKKNAKFKSN